MNKKQFLQNLEKELHLLDKEERQEFIDFYQERFYNGMYYENKTEEEVIAELEPPFVIARNILDQYGINPKQIKQSEERFSGIKTSQVFWLIVVDVFILSWLIPSLFSIVLGIFGGMISYIAVLGLAIGQTSQYDMMFFGLLSGLYLLLFLFGLVVLDLFLWVVKKAIMYHLNVFKFKNRTNINKKMAKVSVDSWFKKHRLFHTVKRFMFIGGLVLVVVYGFKTATNIEALVALYESQEVETQVYTLDVSTDISNSEEWDVIASASQYDVVIIPTESNTITVTHEYEDTQYDFMIEIDEETNQITIDQGMGDYKIFTWSEISVENIMKWIKPDTIIIEIPSTLLIDTIDLDIISGDMEISQVNARDIQINGSSGNVVVSDLQVENDLQITQVSSKIDVNHIESNGNISINNTSGSITISQTSFYDYSIHNVSGRIVLNELNTINQDGQEMDISCTSGDVDLTNVYVAQVDIELVSGDISFNNDDTSFNVDTNYNVVSGQISGNVH
jgi:uncharacterized membrane protein/DUF4097 and DUF4098 domain-containing protein YvlB